MRLFQAVQSRASITSVVQSARWRVNHPPQRSRTAARVFELHRQRQLSSHARTTAATFSTTAEASTNSDSDHAESLSDALRRILVPPEVSHDPRILLDHPFEVTSTRYDDRVEPTVDHKSRHLIHLLQTLYMRGPSGVSDVVTTAQCNVVLHELMAISSVGHSDRAYSIIENMQLFKKRAAAQPQKESRPHIEYELPVPDQGTIKIVFMLNSKMKTVPVRIAERTEQLAVEISIEESSRIDMPDTLTSLMWNCVIMTYRNCDNLHVKLTRMFDVLLTTKQHGFPDYSASHIQSVLAGCESRDRNDESSAMLRAETAVKLWQTVIEPRHNNEDLDSRVYDMLLRIIRVLHKGDDRRFHLFGDCFRLASDNGKVNKNILNEFLVHCGSKKISEPFLGKYLHLTRGMKTGDAVTTLFNALPEEWTHRADKY